MGGNMNERVEAQVAFQDRALDVVDEWKERRPSTHAFIDDSLVDALDELVRARDEARRALMRGRTDKPRHG